LFKFRFLNVILSVITIFSTSAYADARSQLQDIFKGYTSLKADFRSTVYSKKGETISTSTGVLSLKKPSSFMLHTKEPDEQVLFTKGKDVYFYDPLIEQVSIYNIDDLYTSPFMLITSQSESLWGRYKISLNNDTYVLIPNNPKDELKRIELTFEKGILSGLGITFKNDNVNRYTFTSQSQQVQNSDLEYKIPSDVEINDERSSN
jgi:outer membrane lipoprotein carrier protein